MRTQALPHELVETRALDADAEHEEAEEYRELVAVAEPPQVRRQLGRAREQLVARAEARLDPFRPVAGSPQKPPQLGKRLPALRARRSGPCGQRDGADGLDAPVRALV
jgi:hypothetical protein